MGAQEYNAKPPGCQRQGRRSSTLSNGLVRYLSLSVLPGVAMRLRCVTSLVVLLAGIAPLSAIWLSVQPVCAAHLDWKAQLKEGEKRMQTSEYPVAEGVFSSGCSRCEKMIREVRRMMLSDVWRA